MDGWRTSDSTSSSSRTFLAYLLVPVFVSVVLISLFSDFLPTVFGAYADQRFFQVSLMWAATALALIWMSLDTKHQSMLSANWPALLVSSAFLLLTIPDAPGEFSWVEPGMYALFFAAFSVVGWRIYEQGMSFSAAVVFAYVVAISCFFYAAMTMTVYLFAITDAFSDLTDVIPWGFVNMRYWSHMATWLLPILPLALMHGPMRKNTLWRVGITFCAAIWWWMVFMTTARGSMLSIALAGLFACLIYRRTILPWLTISLRFLAFGGLAWVTLSVAIPSIGSDEVIVRTLHAGGSGRMPLWLEAWHMSLNSFPFGMGPQAWIIHQGITESFPANSRLGHPHNMYLMWAAEYGWLLLAAVFMLIATTLKNLLARASQVRRGLLECPAVLVAYTVSAIAGLVHAGFSAVFIVPASMLMGFLVLSIFWALSLRGVCSGEGVSAPASWFSKGSRLNIVLAVVVLTGAIVWMNQVWSYHQAMVADLDQYEEGPNAAYWPRFWFHGNFPRPEG